MTMALLRPLLPLLLLLLSLLHNQNVALVSAADSSSGSTTLQCASGWTRSSGTLQTISPEKINDGYCDCPLDGLDEIETGACAGAMDGMWAGIPPSFSSSSDDGVFICPQQPTLHLPPSRINDGICDCCDGSDESYSNASCPDVCDIVLAEEREARRKLQEDYALGSEGRQASIRQYQQWREELQAKIKMISGRDIVNLERRVEDAKEALTKKRFGLWEEWALAVDEVLSQSTLKEILQSIMDVNKLGMFIVSLCQLSGEASADQVVDGRCLPLDRASLDTGILWNDDDDDGNGNLPSFHIFDAESESIANYADKLVLRLEGKDSQSDSTTRGRAAKKSNSVKRSHPEPDVDDFDDEYDYHDDDYIGDSGDYINEHDDIQDGDDDGKKEDDNDTVKVLLEKLPLLAVRDVFKEHGRALLASSGITDDNADKDTETEEEEEDSASEDEVSDNNVDPMALSMARSTISKRLGNIDRGETSSRSAARFVAAVIEKRSLVMEELQSLALMTIYHSKLSSEDIAEIIYTLTFPPDQQEDGSEQTCSDVRPWSKWCPTVTMIDQDGGKSYPPSIIAAAAERRCSQRGDAVGVCSGEGKEETDVEFPSSVPDGYYAYYAPKVRTTADDLSSFFTAMDSMRISGDFSIAKEVAEDLDTKLESKRQELTKLEKELDSSDVSKYGVDGELFIMRDSCHKIESGKYEYEVCIFGKATQRDIGQKGGGTNLGSWDKVMMENGHRTLKWDKGTKCWNGPVRSAEVIVTCGRATKILSADEPETCRYVFTMESPIACDEQFKVNNSL
ncbi:hypothetical protein ACHAWT_011212 [Skeletonema menzelii]